MSTCRQEVWWARVSTISTQQDFEAEPGGALPSRASGRSGALCAALDDLLTTWSDHDPVLSSCERKTLRWSITLLLLVVMDLVEQQADEPSDRTRSDRRARYAGSALQGLLSGSNLQLSTWEEARRLPNPDDVAAHAFALADAMLRQADRSSPPKADSAGTTCVGPRDARRGSGAR